ncbi:MAG: DUF565 domain-containing protein [Cyanobacteriota bacterium]|nr:DUF565 domain-containing protein [Cyanobacteriota bacterium]
MKGGPLQSTRLERLQGRWGRVIRAQIGDRWATASAASLALLAGIFLGQNLSSVLLWRVSGGRPVVVLVLVISHELVVRLRSRFVAPAAPLGWVLLDNLRIGVVFALVLEAFKLGS